MCDHAIALLCESLSLLGAQFALVPELLDTNEAATTQFSVTNAAEYAQQSQSQSTSLARTKYVQVVTYALGRRRQTSAMGESDGENIASRGVAGRRC